MIFMRLCQGPVRFSNIITFIVTIGQLELNFGYYYYVQRFLKFYFVDNL